MPIHESSSRATSGSGFRDSGINAYIGFKVSRFRVKGIRFRVERLGKKFLVERLIKV